MHRFATYIFRLTSAFKTSLEWGQGARVFPSWFLLTPQETTFNHLSVSVTLLQCFQLKSKILVKPDLQKTQTIKLNFWWRKVLLVLL